jgi:hypothetical protein
LNTPLYVKQIREENMTILRERANAVIDPINRGLRDTGVLREFRVYSSGNGLSIVLAIGNVEVPVAEIHDQGALPYVVRAKQAFGLTAPKGDFQPGLEDVLQAVLQPVKGTELPRPRVRDQAPSSSPAVRW